MKKIIVLALAVLIGATTVASAQAYKQSIGIKGAYGVSLVYKQNISGHASMEKLNAQMSKIGQGYNAFEVAVNLDFYHGLGIHASGAYFWQYPIAAVEGLSWYIGPALSAGVNIGEPFYAHVGIHVQGGIEYKFNNIPLALSLDYGPGLGLYIGNPFALGFSGIGGFGIKYTF